MMSGRRRSIAMVALMAVGSFEAAEAQLLERTPELFPAHPSNRDARYVILRDSCGEIRFEEPATLSQDDRGDWTLQLTQASEEGLCFPVPPDFSTTIHAFQLPTVVRYRLTVAVRPFERPAETFRLTFDESPIPPSITGSWHDPAMPGQGMVLTYAEGGRVDVQWATYEPEGAPLWLVGTGRYTHRERNPHRRTASLYALSQGAFPGTGRATPTSREWGSLSLEYLGCGRLQVGWLAENEERYPAATKQFQQFAGDADNLCDLSRFAHSQHRRVRIYDVQLKHPPTAQPK